MAAASIGMMREPALIIFLSVSSTRHQPMLFVPKSKPNILLMGQGFNDSWSIIAKIRNNHQKFWNIAKKNISLQQ